MYCENVFKYHDSIFVTISLKMVVLWTQTSMILSPVFNFPITPLSCMYLMKHKSDEIDKTNLLELSKN